MSTEDTKLQDLKDLAAALEIIYKTACDHCDLAQTRIFGTSHPEMMKYSLEELQKMKNDALTEWHTARRRYRDALRGAKRNLPPGPLHNDNWYKY